ncbi:MAG: hypothetical protein UFG06_02320 [Lachnospiraceae bacterium]|nr:hypothetical protein [Lachnospiraceae bacterium]
MIFHLQRLFSTAKVKGTKHYLNSQKKYEIIRTVLFFFISLSLFAAGFITTGTRNNLLTIVAVLGCLPACKSLVETIMYCRYGSLSETDCTEIEKHTGGLTCLYDMIYTTREKTFPVLHLTVCGNTIAGYMPDKKLSDTDCAKHLESCLKADNYTGVTVKIFKDLNKYTERLNSLKQLDTEQKLTSGVINTLKSIAL